MSDDQYPYEPPSADLRPSKKPRGPLRGLQKLLLLVLVIVAVSGIVLSVLRHHHLEASAAFYIGLPALLTYLMIMTQRSSSAVGATLKGMTIGLLLSAPLLQEGFLCIIFAAPLFYVVGVVVALIVDSLRKRSTKLPAYPALFLVMIAMFEGTHEDLSFAREYQVRAERIIEASPEAVAAQLAQSPDFAASKPFFLRLFPFPQVAEHEGVEVGQSQRLHFTYYKHIWFNAQEGDLQFEVTERSDHHIASRVLSDSSYLNTYMDWKRSTVSWQAVDETHTRVVWELQYTRKLDPAWYFGPLEYFVAAQTADMLIEVAATPSFAR